MNALRPVLITRRYWPLVGSDAELTAVLAGGLREGGNHPLVLTAAWHGTWPQHVCHRQIRVVRMPYSSRSRWGGYRYTRSISAWLRKNHDRFDAAYVVGLREEAEAAIAALHGSRKPVVLHPVSAGLTGDCHWQLEQPTGERIKNACLKATALVAGDAAQEAELIAAGYPRERIHFIPTGVDVLPPASLWSRDQCRAALVECNRAFYLPQRAPLAIYVGDLLPGQGLETLLEAWPAVLVRHPLACLWLVGDGPLRSELHQACDRLRLHQRVLLPGSFDQVTDLLSSADVFVLPQATAGIQFSLLKAMAVGLPVVATQLPNQTHPLLVDGCTGRLVPEGNSTAMADAILAVLDDPVSAGRMGAAARIEVQAKHSLARCTELHQHLLRSLCDPHFQSHPELISP